MRTGSSAQFCYSLGKFPVGSTSRAHDWAVVSPHHFLNAFCRKTLCLVEAFWPSVSGMQQQPQVTLCHIGSCMWQFSKTVHSYPEYGPLYPQSPESTPRLKQPACFISLDQEPFLRTCSSHAFLSQQPDDKPVAVTPLLPGQCQA